VDCNNATHSVISYLRHGGGRSVLVVLNFTPVVRYGYRLGVPGPGWHAVRLNSDSGHYGGENVGVAGADAEPVPWMGRPWSVSITLPPLAALVLEVP
jgi:1,4-alpha-glucan branching enzyme